MRTLKPLLAVGLAAVTVASSAAVLDAAEPEGFDEFSAGEWLANARAGGTTTARSDGARITGRGDFNVTLEFLVPLAGPTTGSWILSGSSVFTVEAEGVTGTINWKKHSAEGVVTGDRQRLSMAATNIHSTGNFDFPRLGSRPIAATDPFGPIELQVDGRLCDDAWGVWIMSWNSMLEGEGYTPTFDGSWHAVRQSEEFSEDRFREITGELDRVTSEINDLVNQAPVIDDVPIIPWDVAWRLVGEAYELVNLMRNLSLCDQAFLGDEVVRYIITFLTDQIGSLMAIVLLNLELNGSHLSAADLLAMTTLLASVGAIGEGSFFEESALLEEMLESQVESVMSDPNADEDEMTGALAAAEQLGWEFEDGGNGE